MTCDAAKLIIIHRTGILTVVTSPPSLVPLCTLKTSQNPVSEQPDGLMIHWKLYFGLTQILIHMKVGVPITCSLVKRNVHPNISSEHNDEFPTLHFTANLQMFTVWSNLIPAFCNEAGKCWLPCEKKFQLIFVTVLFTRCATKQGCGIWVGRANSGLLPEQINNRNNKKH